MKENKILKIFQSRLKNNYRITFQILELSTTMKKEAEKQGEICLKIEQNLYNANENMENANTQLTRRAETHRVNNKLYLWFAIFLILSVLGVAAYIYVKFFRIVKPDEIATANTPIV